MLTYQPSPTWPRHLGRDCRDPEAKMAMPNIDDRCLSHMKLLQVSHPYVLDSGSPCRNEYVVTFIDTNCPQEQGIIYSHPVFPA